MADADSRMVQTEAQYDITHTVEAREAYHAAKADLLRAQARVCLFWKQKARVKWLQEGNANTAYYHTLVKDRRRKQHISGIVASSGEKCLSEDAIQAEVVRFYSDLFAESPTSDHEAILQHIIAQVTAEDNIFLLALPQLVAEVKETVWALYLDSVTGPDGFHGRFYRHC